MPLPTRRAARADLPTAWGGEIGADSPPGALRAPTSPLRGEAKLAPTPHPARCARRLPTRRARFASWPTSPRGGEARLPTHPAPTSPLRGEAKLAPTPRPAPTSPLRGEAKLAPTPHPASSLRELADLPAWRGGEILSAGPGRGFVGERRFRRRRPTGRGR